MTDYLFKVPFGSRVYNLTNSRSDEDFIYIVSDKSTLKSTNENDEIVTESVFQEQLNDHNIKALEAYFYDPKLQMYFQFDLDLQLLRKSVSAVVSNSHVKAKKKFIDKEIYIGLKSYFHSIRILVMMNYLAKHGEFRPEGFVYELEYIYQDILSRQSDDPETLFVNLERDYKKMLKNLQHCFRMYCPK